MNVMHNIRAKLTTFGLYASMAAAWTAASLWLPDGRLREIITTLWLLTMPGFVVWRAIVGQAGPRLSYKVCGYVLALSLLFLMVTGLLLNEGYTLAGASRPFARLPLTFAISGSVIGISILAAARATKVPAWPSHFFKKIKNIKQKALTISVVIAGLILPVFAVLGAIMLNNGSNAGIALIAMFALAALLILLVLRERDLGKFYGYILYCMGLSTLLATSMRGWNITGHDIMQEYQVFQLTLSHQAWHMNYYHDAYTACLSITILPTILQKITGIYAPYIFKFVFQILFAAIVPILYGSLRTYASRRTALLATFLFISFPTFITDVAMLNRQEIALFFFALVFQVGTDTVLTKRLRDSFVFLFMVGLVLSHYSSSYVAIGALISAFVIGIAWKMADPALRKARHVNLAALSSIVSPRILLASTLVLIGWGTIATQTSNNLTQTLGSINNVLHGKHLKSDGMVIRTAPTTLAQYTDTVTQARSLPANNYYPASAVAKYPVQAGTDGTQANTSLSRILHIPRSLLQLGYGLIRTGYALLIEGCVSLGVIYMAFKKRSPTTPPRQYLLAGMGIMVIVLLQIVLPAAINYGLTRILQQALVLLALPTILTIIWLLGLIRIPRRAAEVVLGAALAVFFLVISGAIPALTGGYKPNLTSANSGFYYTAYYTHQDEIAAAQWLKSAPPKGSRIYSDEFTRRKLITYGDVYAQPTLLPGAIPIDSYVMLSHGDVEFNQVPAYDASALLYYKLPTAFLQSNKDLVYSSADVQIYK